MQNNRKAFTLIELLTSVSIAGILVAIILGTVAGGCTNYDDQRVVIATVKRVYIDSSGGGNSAVETHYMVSTDIGIFEVKNIAALRLYNADEIYGFIEEKKTYALTIVGQKVLTATRQQYPFIIKVELPPGSNKGVEK